MERLSNGDVQPVTTFLGRTNSYRYTFGIIIHTNQNLAINVQIVTFAMTLHEVLVLITGAAKDYHRRKHFDVTIVLLPLILLPEFNFISRRNIGLSTTNH